MISDDLYVKASKAIKDVHASDAERTLQDGIHIAAELLYSERMRQILLEYINNEDYTLQLAAQCQHFERWKVARGTYTMDRIGYHQWRKAVMDYQIKRTIETLASTGIENTDIQEIKEILVNQGNKRHIKAQIIQDVACIVFIIWYLEEFAGKHNTEKVIDIVAKTSRKMSENGIKFLNTKTLSPIVKNILAQVIQ